TLFRSLDEEGGDKHSTHDDGYVDQLDGLPDHLTDAWPAEDRLDDDDAAHEHSDVEPYQRHDRQDGVLQHVLQDHLARDDAFGSGCAHVILAQYVDHGAASDAGVPAAAGQAHGDGGQHDVQRRAVASQREDRQQVGEGVDEQQADDELRRRDADERQGHHRLVDPGPALERGD